MLVLNQKEGIQFKFENGWTLSTAQHLNVTNSLGYKPSKMEFLVWDIDETCFTNVGGDVLYIESKDDFKKVIDWTSNQNGKMSKLKYQELCKILYKNN